MGDCEEYIGSNGDKDENSNDLGTSDQRSENPDRSLNGLGTLSLRDKNPGCSARSLNGPDIISDHSELREALLALIYEEEHSAELAKTFRIQSNTDPYSTNNITIEAKTRLGAVIAFADWHDVYWDYFIEELEDEDDKSIQNYAQVLVQKMFIIQHLVLIIQYIILITSRTSILTMSVL